MGLVQESLRSLVRFRSNTPKPATVVAEEKSYKPYSFMDFWKHLTDDGDPSLFVWCFALLGQAPLFLIAGCIYIFLLLL